MLLQAQSMMQVLREQAKTLLIHVQYLFAKGKQVQQ